MVAVQSISLQWHMSLQCGNNENLHTYVLSLVFDKKFMKSTFLLISNYIKSWFNEIFGASISRFSILWSHHSWFQVLSNCNPSVRYRLQVVSYYCFGYGSQKMKANASQYIRRTRGLLLSNAALSLWKYVEAATRSDAHTVKKGAIGGARCQK